MKNKISPLIISIGVHLFIIFIFMLMYINFTSKSGSFEENKISIKLNNIATYAQKSIEANKIKEEKIQTKIIKPKVLQEEKKFIVVKEDIKPQKTELQKIQFQNKVLQNTTIQKKIQIDENKIQNKQTKEIDVTKQYIDKNKILIAQLLKDNLHYPRSARKRGKTGEVIVKFVITKDSLVHSLEIISSKSEILSRGAMKTIKNLSGKFPPPKEEITIIVPIKYSLI